MPIENRNLEPGTKLIARYKKETHHALVVAGEDGKVRYTLIPNNGKEYKSPSSRGTAITSKACNGWSFWSVDTSETEEAEPTTLAEPEEPTSVPVDEESGQPAPMGSFKRVPNQRGVDEGPMRLYCDTCRSSFIVPADKNPETCPLGHMPS